MSRPTVPRRHLNVFQAILVVLVIQVLVYAVWIRLPSCG